MPFVFLPTDEKKKSQSSLCHSTGPVDHEETKKNIAVNNDQMKESKTRKKVYVHFDDETKPKLMEPSSSFKETDDISEEKEKKQTVRP